MPGMASNIVGVTHKSSYTDKPPAVTGYTGLVVPPNRDWGEATAPDAFPGLPKGGGAPVPMLNMVNSFHEEKRRHESKIQQPGYRTPGYAGHTSGHQHVCGFTYGAICCGAAGRATHLASIGPGAPGISEGVQLIKGSNLQKGAPLPAGLSKTKMGYTGHLHGRHYSTNFGESFAATAEKLLQSADAGHVTHVGEFKVPRPMRQKVAISGYGGFRPRTTPATLD